MSAGVSIETGTEWGVGRDLGLPVGHQGEGSSRKEDCGFRAEVF